MKKALLLAIACGLAIAVLGPEVRRYRAERALAQYEALAQLIRRRPALADNPRLRAAIVPAGRVRSHPGDWRPLLVAASLLGAAGDRTGAAAKLEEALALGERPEVNVNLAALLWPAGDQKRANDLLIRAIWVSPAVAAHVRRPSRLAALQRVADMERQLQEGSLGEDDFPLPRR